jgi:hypothetical protein
MFGNLFRSMFSGFAGAYRGQAVRAHRRNQAYGRGWSRRRPIHVRTYRRRSV